MDERKRDEALPWSCFSGLGRFVAGVDVLDFWGFFDDDGPGFVEGGAGCGINSYKFINQN